MPLKDAATTAPVIAIDRYVISLLTEARSAACLLCGGEALGEPKSAPAAISGPARGILGWRAG
jgi:hypothetical protein